MCIPAGWPVNWKLTEKMTRKPWHRAIPEAAKVLLLAIILAQLFWVAAYTGLWWRILGHGIGRLESRAVEKSLFEADVNRSYRAAAIGSDRFIDMVQKVTGSESDILPVPIPRPNLPAALAAVSSMGRFDPGLVFIQNPPYFWVNMNIERELCLQDLDLWRQYGEWDPGIAPLREVGLFFDVFRLYAQGLAGGSPQKGLPRSLFGTWIDFDRVYEEYLDGGRPFGPIQPGKVYWVADYSPAPLHQNEDVADDFRELIESMEARPELGRFILPEDLPEILDTDPRTGVRKAKQD